MRIEFLKGGHMRDGHHEIAAREAHTVFDPSFLVALCRRAEVALKEVVTAKGHKGPLFLADASLHQDLDSRPQIVVSEAMRHATKVFKGAHMPLKKGFLFLSRKGHNETAPRVVEAHHKVVDRLRHAGDDGLS